MSEIDVLAEPVQAICINSSAIPVQLQPLAAGLSQLLSMLSVFVGGIIGLYILFLFLQWRERVMITKQLKQIQHELAQIKKKLKIKDSQKGLKGRNKLKKLFVK
ncbi:MAG: hypothetical protein Q8O89_00530 [Nanoarchaeota archaeon]|nr:hypothetical protein [Nanoarchaeota archaeon]